MSYPAYQPQTFDPVEYQKLQDAEHLNLLTIFHYVLGGLNALTALAGLIYVGLGAMMLANTHVPSDAFMAWLFICLGASFTLFYSITGWLNVHAGRCLKARRGHKLATVMAAINCLHVPTGTALGVFTLIVLNRPSVKGLFGQQTAGAPSLETRDRPWYQGQY